MLETFPERIAGDRHAASLLQMDVDLNVAQDVTGDGNVSFLRHRTVLDFLARQPLAEDSDIGTSRRFAVVLQSAARDGHFVRASIRRIQQDVCRGCVIRRHIAFQIARPNMNIADLTPPRDDSAAGTITDVSTNNIRLMQIDAIEVNTNAPVVI